MNARKAFSVAMLVGTALPFLLWARTYSAGTLPQYDAVQIFSAVAVFHVASTFTLYTNRDFKDVLSTNRPLYWALGIGLPFWFALVLEILPSQRAYITMFVGAALTLWQVYHFGKQNLGVFSLMNLAEGGPKLRRGHHLMFYAVAWCAVLGTMPYIFTDVPAYQAVAKVARVVSLVGTIAVLIWAVADLIRNWSSYTVMTATMLLMGAGFFASLHLVDHYGSAALPFSFAHAIQYLIIIFLVGVKSEHYGTGWISMRPLRIACNVVLLLAVTWGAAELWGNTEADWNVVRGVMGNNFVGDYFVTLMQVLPITILAAHFFIDSGVWRLSQPKQRAFVFSRLTFLRPTQSSPAMSPSASGRVQPAE